jgi:hypothetical protein
VTGAGDPDECGVGEGHARCLSLASVNPVEAPEAAGDAGSRNAGAAVCAPAVAVRGWRDNQIALSDAADVGADIRDHADELVAERARLGRRLAAVVPEVSAADARQHDADDGIGGLDDNRVGAVRDLDHAGGFEDRRTHGAATSGAGIGDTLLADDDGMCAHWISLTVWVVHDILCISSAIKAPRGGSVEGTRYRGIASTCQGSPSARPVGL